MTNMATAKFKVLVHIEAVLRPECTLPDEDIRCMVDEEIKSKSSVFSNGPIAIDSQERLNSVVSSLEVVDLAPGRRVSFWQAQVCLHVFRLSEQPPESDYLEMDDQQGGGSGEQLPASEQWELPNALLHGLWDSIVVDPAVKSRLLSYCSTSIQFSEAQVDSDIISWNRMALLHGPPGTEYFIIQHRAISAPLTITVALIGQAVSLLGLN